MSLQAINVVVYFLIVVIKHILPYATIGLGFYRWSVASSANNIKKQTDAIKMVTVGVIALITFTYVPIVLLGALNNLGKSNGAITWSIVPQILSLLQLLVIGYIPIPSFILSYIIKYQYMITDGKKSNSKSRQRLFQMVGIFGTVVTVIILEIFKRMLSNGGIS